jgi:hypothetical protein
MLRKKLLEEQEFALELERRQLAELQFIRKSVANQPYSGCLMDGLKVSEGFIISINSLTLSGKREICWFHFLAC